MAAKSTLLNMTLCLTVVCLLCSALLGVVYSMTAEPVKQAERQNLLSSLKQVLPEGSDISDKALSLDKDGVTYEYYTAKSPKYSEVVAVKSTVSGFGGPLTVLVGICDGTVYNTRVLSHSETPGLGAKCEEAGSAFILQFKGLDPSKKKVGLKADGGDLDAITASTITSRAYTKAVANALGLFAQNIDAPSGASANYQWN
ncbi:MAG: RnfABCDGE type electron transport complex subunit G [Bacteroidales bacterium]|nr:RnfABCDGE type electron transport complex subunit G [Bacteroidales bacterium]